MSSTQIVAKRAGAPLPRRARRRVLEMAAWDDGRVSTVRSVAVEQLTIVDQKSAALLQFIGVLVAVVAIVASLVSFAAPPGAAGLRTAEIGVMIALLAVVMLAGAYGLSCVHLFDMAGKLRRRRQGVDETQIQRELTCWLQHVLESRRLRYRIAYVLTWLGFLLIMILVTLHVASEGGLRLPG